MMLPRKPKFVSPDGGMPPPLGGGKKPKLVSPPGPGNLPGGMVDSSGPGPGMDPGNLPPMMGGPETGGPEPRMMPKPRTPMMEGRSIERPRERPRPNQPTPPRPPVPTPLAGTMAPATGMMGMEMGAPPSGPQLARPQAFFGSEGGLEGGGFGLPGSNPMGDDDAISLLIQKLLDGAQVF